MFDPYLCLAKLFATRSSLRLLMVFTLVWVIICLGLSGWQYQNAPGDMSLVKWAKGASYGSNWDAFCGLTPYVYLAPFSFSFQQFNMTSTGMSSTVLLNTQAKTKCGWPSQNSSLRLTICVFSLLTIIALFFNTKFSLLARPAFFLFSFLFFVSFVLDANSSYVGQAECQTNFKDTRFGMDLTASGVILACVESDFSGLTFIDFLVMFLFGLLNTAWMHCKEPYGQSGGSGGDANQSRSHDETFSVDEPSRGGDDNTL
jgi:hypothetical protein